MPHRALCALFACAVFLFLCVPTFSQKALTNANAPPKYDVRTEMKAKGVVDEVNSLPWANKLEMTELILKSGDDKFHVYVCPKPFQQEMGISFSKGDEIAVTGSKVKQESTDVILAREVAKGTDTLIVRDDKGSPVWNSRTGK